jgi:hypothetical protein
LLGAHIRRRAQDGAAGRELDIPLDSLGQAEVGDVRAALGVGQHVGRLQVAVEDAAHVGVMQRLGHLGHERRGGARVVLSGVQATDEAPPGDQLHGEVALAVVLAHLVERHDPGVVEQRHGLGLVLEPPQIVVVGQDAGLDHFKGHRPVETELAGLVDDAHAAAAQLAADLVVAEVGDPGAAGEEDRYVLRAALNRGDVAIDRVGCEPGVGGRPGHRPGLIRAAGAGLGRVAMVAPRDRRRGSRCRRRNRGGPQRVGQLSQANLGGQDLAQLGLEVGVPGQSRGELGGRAGVGGQ